MDNLSSSENSIRTPSPGQDYSHLLNDTDLTHLDSERHSDRSSNEKEVQSLKLKISEERKKYQEELDFISKEVLMFKDSIDKTNRERSLETQILSSKLKDQEDYYLKIIHQRDLVIQSLESKITTTKAREISEVPIIDIVSNTRTEDNPKIYTKEKQLTALGNKTNRTHLQNISRIIVTVEKEIADLKLKIKEGNKSRKLIEEFEKYQLRLNEAQKIQEDLIRASLA